MSPPTPHTRSHSSCQRRPRRACLLLSGVGRGRCLQCQTPEALASREPVCTDKLTLRVETIERPQPEVDSIFVNAYSNKHPTPLVRRLSSLTVPNLVFSPFGCVVLGGGGETRLRGISIWSSHTIKFAKSFLGSF